MTKKQIQAVYKFNGGLGALLCSGCYVILRSGASLTKADRLGMNGEITNPPAFCKECGEKYSPMELCKLAERNAH